MSKAQAIKLKYPVQWGSDLVEEIIINRPKGKAMRKMPTQEDGEVMSQMFEVLAELINKPPAFVDEMDIEDIQAALEVMKSFFTPGRGKPSSKAA